MATIVEHHPLKSSEDGYSLEVFNALGETIAVVTVPESDIETLRSFSWAGEARRGPKCLERERV